MGYCPHNAFHMAIHSCYCGSYSRQYAADWADDHYKNCLLYERRMCAELQDSYAAADAMGKCFASDSSDAWDSFGVLGNSVVLDNFFVERVVLRAAERVVRDDCCCAYLRKKIS